MPLPDPDYLTDEEFNWNDTQFPAVQLVTSATKTGVKRTIRWDALDSYDRRRVHDLIMGYAIRAGLTEATAVTGFAPGEAYQVANYEGAAVGASSTGLTAGVNYTFSVVLNAAETFFTINGTDGQTFTTLVAAINVALPATMNAAISATDNIEIESVATGTPQVIEVFDGTLFNATTGFRELQEIRVGVDGVEDVFDLNLRNGYQSYTELLIGKLRAVHNQTFRPARSVNDIYFNHGTKTWLSIQTDL